MKVNEFKLEMLRLLIKDPKIKSCLLADGNLAGCIRVLDNGDLRLGKYKSGWKNWLFNSWYTMDFFTLANKIAVIITGKDTLGGDPNDFKKMVMEIIEKCMVSKNIESVIELLFQYVVLFCAGSPLRSEYMKLDDKPTNRSKNMKVRGMSQQAYLDLGHGSTLPFILEIVGE